MAQMLVELDERNVAGNGRNNWLFLFRKSCKCTKPMVDALFLGLSSGRLYSFCHRKTHIGYNGMQADED